eukprot:6174857-Pleurochrysis_carterae.AAC.4
MEPDGRGNYALARVNKHPRDCRIQFDEPSHKYTVDGKIVTLSVTGLWTEYFDHFNPFGTAIKMHKKWAVSGKYAILIAYMQLVEEKCDSDIVEGIVQFWSANGRRASDIGTAMHALFEQLLNGAEFSTASPHTIAYLVGSPNDGEDMRQLSMYLNIVHEMDLEQQLLAFTNFLTRLRIAAFEEAGSNDTVRRRRQEQADAVERCISFGFPNPYTVTDLEVELGQFREVQDKFINVHKLEPFRTEWSIFHEEADLAGQIDALYIQQDTCEFWMVDWKRVDPEKGLLSPTMASFANRRGKGPCRRLPDTSYGHYACQQNLYARILELKYDMHISQLYLAQLHHDLGPGVYNLCNVEKMPELADELIALRISSLSSLKCV